jgi:hypothetical protein
MRFNPQVQNREEKSRTYMDIGILEFGILEVSMMTRSGHFIVKVLK